MKITGVLGRLSTNRKKRWIRGDEHVDSEALKGSKSIFLVPVFFIFFVIVVRINMNFRFRFSSVKSISFACNAMSS